MSLNPTKDRGAEETAVTEQRAVTEQHVLTEQHVVTEHHAAAEHARRWKTRRLVTAVGALLIAAALLVPPLLNINRYKKTIAASIGRSLGRPVHLDQVGLRLLPTPAFTLENFAVGEDPAFGAEPVVRAATVTATLHVSSLWRGRLEFSSIALDDPSVNLVRNSSGAWNAESILLQAAQIQTAPTAQKRAGSLPRFPYIQATNARVNIKMGMEKLPLSFTEARFALWLDGPSEWHVRAETRPTRTDLNTSDTGTLKLDGKLQRAASLGQVPVQMHIEWSKAQLGEVSRLLLGRDIGWRGALDGSADVNGTFADAQIASHLRLAAIHREEFVPARSLDLQADCTAHALNTHLNGSSNSLEDISCRMPVDSGELALAGHVTSLRDKPQAAMELVVHQVPAQSMLEMLRHANNQVAPELTAEGVLNGTFTYGPQVVTSQHSGKPQSRKQTGGDATGPARWQGEAGLPELTMRAPELTVPLVMEHLVLRAGGAAVPVPPASRRHTTALTAVPAPGLTLEPVTLSGGGPSPVALDGHFDRAGYTFHLSGPAGLNRLLALDQTLHFLGTSSPGLAPTGDADMDITLHGPWEQPLIGADTVARSILAGSMALHGARIYTSLPGGPVDVASARIRFAPDATTWDNIAASYAGLHVEGSITRPVACKDEDGQPTTSCDAQFMLSASALDLGKLHAFLSAGAAAPTSLFSVFQQAKPTLILPHVRGTFKIAALTLGQLQMRDAVAELSFKGNTATLHSFTASTLGGRAIASGSLQISPAASAYSVDAGLTGIRMKDAAALFHEGWGPGTADTQCSLTLQGNTQAALLDSTQGTCHWNWRGGTLSSKLTSSTGPGARQLPFQQWQGDAKAGGRMLRITDSTATLNGKTQTISGSIGFDRTVKLQWGETELAGSLDQTKAAAPAPTLQVKK